MLFDKLREKHNYTKRMSLIAGCVLLVLLISGCSQPAAYCYQQPLADLSEALVYAGDDQLKSQFPLDELGKDMDPVPAKFCSGGGIGSKRKYHAAEDYHLPAGSPVYAFADGRISFSGPMGGYGWLIIIDHPQANIYSLYGHLSPSRWLLKSGSVEKGDLIAYLGNPDENGGSAENPLIPHLHFGIRVGQRTDYPGMGEWRWMAGWIKPCPSDLGWLQPSKVISGQEIPPGGFPEPNPGLFEKWAAEIIIGGIYAVCGVFALIYAIKKKNAISPIIYGSMMIFAGLYFSTKGTRMNYALYFMAVISFVVAIYLDIQGRKAKQKEGEENKG
jgi:hypothetical protein